MQLNSLYLYPIRVDLYTNYSDNGTLLGNFTTERYRRVYNRNLKVYRGSDNRLDIQVKNPDQKPLSYNGSTLVFNLFTAESDMPVLKKDVTNIDATKGTARLFLTENDLINLEIGFYRYSFTQEKRSTIEGTDEYTVLSRNPLYMDSQYGAIATLEIAGDLQGSAPTSINIDQFSYTNPAATGEPESKFYISSIVDAQPLKTTPQSLHTFQFYCTNYTGDIDIQASIEPQGATPSKWATVESLSVIDQNNFYINVEGKYSWFRIKHVPNSAALIGSFVVQQTTLGSYVVDIEQPGKGYQLNDVVVIKGSRLGGESTTNDLTITITGVDTYGEITNISWTGLSYVGVRTFVLSGETPNVGTLDKVLYR